MYRYSILFCTGVALWLYLFRMCGVKLACAFHERALGDCGWQYCITRGYLYSGSNHAAYEYSCTHSMQILIDNDRDILGLIQAKVVNFGSGWGVTNILRNIQTSVVYCQHRTHLHIQYRKDYTITKSLIVNKLHDLKNTTVNFTRYRLYQHGLILFSTWIRSYIHNKIWDEISYLFINFAALNFGSK